MTESNPDGPLLVPEDAQERSGGVAGTRGHPETMEGRTATRMRTKRRFAHELYPHPGEGEIRSLVEELPYLYAHAVGWQSLHSGWMDDKSPEGMQRGMERILTMIAVQFRAFIADALVQGLTGDEAWQWAEERNQANNGVEWTWERALHYGVDPDVIKPYPCGDEPTHHDHVDSPDARGWRTVHRVEGRESECPECCEPVAATEAVL